MYEAYKGLGARLGLALEPPDPGVTTFSFTVSGRLDGRPIHVTRICGSGAVTVTKCPLASPLDLGLKLSRAGVIASVGELLGAVDISLGISGFDEAFAIRGDEPDRVRALVGRDVRGAMMEATSATLTVDDTEVAMHTRSEGEDEWSIERAMRQAIAIANAIDEAAKSVPPASAFRAHHAELVTLGERRALRVTATPFTLDGSIGHTRLRLYGRRTSAKEHTLLLTAETKKPLGVELSVMSRRSFLGRLLHAAPQGPVDTGDEAFENAFEARAKDAEAARRALGANVRGRLLELASLGAVFFDDHDLGVQTEPGKLPPALLESTLESMRAIVEARYEDQAQPYR